MQGRRVCPHEARLNQVPGVWRERGNSLVNVGDPEYKRKLNRYNELERKAKRTRAEEQEMERLAGELAAAEM